MYHPLALITTATLSGIPRYRLLKSPRLSGDFYQLGSYGVGPPGVSAMSGHCLWSCCLRTTQTCSIGLRSGE